MSEYDFKKIEISLDQIAGALERLSPPPSQYPSFENHDAFVWNTAPDHLKPVIQVSRVELDLLVGIDRARDILLENTLKFSEGLSANNALLWGARGMGKSTLIKAVHQKIIDKGKSLKIVELQREDLASVSRLLDILRTSSQRFLLFCDDLSFSHDDQHYKSLKAVLDGGLEGRPENVLFYATSNRRHLMPRDMIENEKSSSINPSEAVEEKVSLSDRFGLWLGFHPCTQDEYLEMIARYCKAYELSLDFDFIKAQAIEWQATRGARSGRVAWQFFVDLAAKTNTNIDN
ncbi:MAG: ATP-binding protein [Rhodobacterales bacterium]|nr:ATP-binding protein [Rhodobacterales bacterium]